MCIAKKIFRQRRMEGKGRIHVLNRFTVKYNVSSRRTTLVTQSFLIVTFTAEKYYRLKSKTGYLDKTGLHVNG